MRALVTGANGHIGAHVVRAAKAAGMEPIAFVRGASNLLAVFAERKARKKGEDAAITRGQIADVYGKHLAYDSSKATAELGWRGLFMASAI